MKCSHKYLFFINRVQNSVLIPFFYQSLGLSFDTYFIQIKDWDPPHGWIQTMSWCAISRSWDFEIKNFLKIENLFFKKGGKCILINSQLRPTEC